MMFHVILTSHYSYQFLPGVTDQT
uniref:Uncharacterized protein n=1 Tax=Amphimedon queenslandica TaxID=400682 RepID=A0A1X7TV85_AMPQE